VEVGCPKQVPRASLGMTQKETERHTAPMSRDGDGAMIARERPMLHMRNGSSEIVRNSRTYVRTRAQQPPWRE